MIDCPYGWPQGIISLGFLVGLALMTTGMMQKVLQLSFSDQLVQIVSEVPTILYGMSVVLVVLAIKVLIALRGLSGHLIRPPKVWLVLDFLQHLMHWFSEYNTDSLCVGCL